MKTNLLFAAAGLFMLSACNNQPSYTLHGTVPDTYPDGSQIYMLPIGGTDTLNTATIKYHSFTLKGPVQKVQECILMCNNGDQSLMGNLILEEGEMHIKLHDMPETNNNAQGTLLNDKYYNYQNEVLYNTTKKYQLKKLLLDPDLTEAKADSLEKVYVENARSFESMNAQTINENINNAFGVSVFAAVANLFKVEQQKEWLSQIPADLKDQRIDNIQKQVEAIERSSVGQKYIDFTATSLEGKEVKLSEAMGQSKYTLIDFWASWCMPCRAEMPNVIKLYEKYHKQGFNVIGVSLDADENKWKQAVNDLKLPWFQLKTGKSGDPAALYAVTGIPTTILIDENGVIIARKLRGEALQQKLEELMK